MAYDTPLHSLSLTREAMPMSASILSNRRLPRLLRTIEGVGLHSFRRVNVAGQSTF